MIEHDDRIAQPHDEIHVVLDEQERQPARVQLPDALLDLLDEQWIDAGGRLVEEYEPRVGHQHGRELEQLLLSVREVAGTLVREPREPELLQQLERAHVLLLAHRTPERRAPGLLERSDHVLHERQVGEDARLLERAREAAAGERHRIGPADARAGEADRPCVRPQVARDQVERRRLAGSVRADERGHRALGHDERAVADGSDAAEALRQAIDLEQRRAHACASSRTTGSRCVRRRSRIASIALRREGRIPRGRTRSTTMNTAA